MRLIEGISPILYRILSVNELEKILKTDRYDLKLAFSDSLDRKGMGKYVYYKSFSRTLSNAFFKKDSLTSKVKYIIKVDGRALNSNVKGVPVNYYRYRRESEAEDRIISNKPFVKNARKTILEIMIFIPNDILSSFSDSLMLSDLMINKVPYVVQLAEKYNIPYNFYKFKNRKIYNRKVSPQEDARLRRLLKTAPDTPIRKPYVPEITNELVDSMKFVIDLLNGKDPVDNPYYLKLKQMRQSNEGEKLMYHIFDNIKIYLYMKHSDDPLYRKFGEGLIKSKIYDKENFVAFLLDYVDKMWVSG